MEWVETTGRTIEEAKEEALDRLEIDESELEFEILEEPKTGLFGRLRGEARIRARVQPKAPRAKQERRPRKPRTRSDKPKSDAAPEVNETAETVEAAAPAAEKPKTTSRSGNGRSRGGRDRAKTSNGNGADTKEGSTMSDEVVPVGTQADMVTEFLEGLLDAFGTEGSVERKEIDDETVELSVSGKDLGVLIGPKGQTITAVHELSRTVLQRRATGRHEGRVRIDIGGYRQRRQEALARFVTQLAEGVLETGTARALEPMNAADRKVVHDTINEIDGVATISEGADPHRRVVIVIEGADA